MNRVAELKSKYNLVKLLGVSRQAVDEWDQNLPPLRAIQVEYITGGKFKAIELINQKKVGEWK